MVKLVAIFWLISLCSAKYRDCGSKQGSLVSLSVSGCDVQSNTKCIFKKRTSVTIEIGFTNVDTKTITAVVHGILGGVAAPFPMPDNDGCHSVTCPVKSDQSYKYKSSLDVYPVYPSFAVEVKWELKDDNGEDFICVIIPGRIQG